MAIEAANFSYPWFLINLKLRSSSFRRHQIFPTLMVQMLFPQMAPGPDFRKVRKSLMYNRPEHIKKE